MDFRDLKEYTKLNLQRTGLCLSDGDRKKTEPLSGTFQSIAEADALLDAFHQEVADKRIERFCYANMSLSYWALLVCMSLLGMLLDEYLKEGTLVVELSFAWALYILPALFLVGRLFLFSFVNIAHCVLLVICAALSLFQIRIFGSVMNWIWVFLVLGTLLTLGGRLWERGHRMKENTDWWKKNLKTIQDAEKAIAEASSVYTALGGDAEEALRKQYPGISRPPRLPWFAYKRKKNRDGRYRLEDVPQVPTDFLKKKVTHEEEIDKPVEHGTRYVTVEDHFMGYEEIHAERAQELISRGTLHPYFGMAVPQFIPELKYSLYSHRWTEQIREVGTASRVITSKHYTGERSKAKMEAFDNEWEHLGTSAEVVAARTGSTAVYVAAQEYISKRDAKLNQLSDYETHTHHLTERFDRKTTKQYNERAVLRVMTPDGALVGLYCADNLCAIVFAENVAQQAWNARLTGWATPSTSNQSLYLNHRTV